MSDRAHYCWGCGEQVVYILEGGGRATVVNHNCLRTMDERKKERKRVGYSKLLASRMKRR